MIVDLRSGCCTPPGYTAALSDTITGRLKSSAQSNRIVEQTSDIRKVKSLLSKVSVWFRTKSERQSIDEEYVGREGSQIKSRKINNLKKVTRLDKSSVIVDLRSAWCTPRVTPPL